MPVDTDPGPPEDRTLDPVVLSGRSERKKERKEKKKKKKRLMRFDIQQIWTLSGGSGSGVGLTSSDHSRHLGFKQLSDFRKGYAFLKADTLNLLLLLPDRAIFSR